MLALRLQSIFYFARNMAKVIPPPSKQASSTNVPAVKK